MALNEPFDCPAETLAHLLGKKWVPQLIELLAQKNMRFGELVRCLNGSQPKMVKQQLNLLETHQLISNTKITLNNQTQSIYCLTEKGHSLFLIVKQMKAWGSQHLTC